MSAIVHNFPNLEALHVELERLITKGRSLLSLEKSEGYNAKVSGNIDTLLAFLDRHGSTPPSFRQAFESPTGGVTHASDQDSPSEPIAGGRFPNLTSLTSALLASPTILTNTALSWIRRGEKVRGIKHHIHELVIESIGYSQALDDVCAVEAALQSSHDPTELDDLARLRAALQGSLSTSLVSENVSKLEDLLLRTDCKALFKKKNEIVEGVVAILQRGEASDH